MKEGFFQSILDGLNDLGLIWKYGLNGLIGGFIWSMYEKSKFWSAVRQIIIGGVIAGYVTGVIVAKFNVDPSFVGFLSFVIGMSGLAIVDSISKWVLKLIKKYKDAIVIINQKSSTTNDKN